MNFITTTKEIEKVAVLITCHNRCYKTLRCLYNLSHQNKPSNLGLTIYLVDAGSNDKTVALVRKFFPTVNVIKSHDYLYWGGGMRLAFQEAKKKI